jgi:hypothetical protein
MRSDDTIANGRAGTADTTAAIRPEADMEARSYVRFLAVKPCCPALDATIPHHTSEFVDERQTASPKPSGSTQSRKPADERLRGRHFERLHVLDDGIGPGKAKCNAFDLRRHVTPSEELVPP